MKYLQYENRLVRVTAADGSVFTGVAERLPSGSGLQVSGRAEEGIRIGAHTLFESGIAKIECLPTYEEAVRTILPGRYRHFKGNEYEVLAIARHSETAEPMVVYRALYGEGGVWVRPAAMWNETVERNGQTFRRFTRVAEETSP